MTRDRTPAFPWLYVLALCCLGAISISAPPKWHESARPCAWTLPIERPLLRPRAMFATLPTGRWARPQIASPTPASPPIDYVAATRPEPTIELHRAPVPVDPPSLGDSIQREPAPPVIEAPPAPPPPPRVQWWPMPEQLLADLDASSQFPEARDWSDRTRRWVLQLNEVERLEDPRVGPILAELEDLAAEQNTLLPFIPEGPRATAFRRAGLSLLRRLDVWQELPRWLESDAAQGSAPPPTPDAQRLAACLQALKSEPSMSSETSNWGNYLELEALEQLAATPAGDVDREHAHRLASKVLARLERTGLGSAAATRPNAWHRLYLELCHWVARPIEPRQMLALLEQFESSGLPSDAARVADACRRLASAGNECQQHLADMLATHYRNANLRVAISREFMNRLVQ
ncbi:MAG TPA: hypothetical protein VG713_08820, partial [Pirellulales bacterium]|nr:hypothetical protein [Pirellulales bacterium]